MRFRKRIIQQLNFLMTKSFFPSSWRLIGVEDYPIIEIFLTHGEATAISSRSLFNNRLIQNSCRLFFFEEKKWKANKQKRFLWRLTVCETKNPSSVSKYTHFVLGRSDARRVVWLLASLAPHHLFHYSLWTVVFRWFEWLRGAREYRDCWKCKMCRIVN